jgi:microcystin-dependent protein
MDPLIGTIVLFAGTYVPKDWALCDGHLLPIAPNVPLFSILGTNYGGDGTTNFAVPKLKAPLKNSRYIIAMTGKFPTPS